MKFVCRWLFRLLVLLVVLVVALVLLKDILIKSVLENQWRTQTGLEVRIGSLDVGLFTPTVTVENLKIYNSAEFGGFPLVDLPELHAEYDRHSLAQQRLRLTLLRVNLAEIDVVRSRQGQNNLETLLGRLEAPAKSSGSLDFAGIDLLNLSLGKLKFIDLSQPTNNREVHIGLKGEVLHNVKSLNDISSLAGKVLLQGARGWWGRSNSIAGGAASDRPKSVTPSVTRSRP
jgi:uncharacterized protein involved in outer membrane biogenesis